MGCTFKDQGEIAAGGDPAVSSVGEETRQILAAIQSDIRDIRGKLMSIACMHIDLEEIEGTLNNIANAVDG